MNLTKSQPLSYKDFMKKIDQTSNKENKLTKNIVHNKSHKKVTLNNHKSNQCRTPHTQSTSIWDKPSTSRNKLAHKQKSALKSHNQSITNQDNSVSFKQSTRKKDQALCYYGFVKEATKSLTSIIQISSPQLLCQKISYIQFLQAMKNLKMIRQTYEPFPNDIVSQLWTQYISGQSVGNFILVLCSILGISFEGKISEADDYIKRKYESLLYTRLQLNGSSKKQYQNQFSFRPQISERSRKLATSRSKSKSKTKRNLGCAYTERANTSVGYNEGLSSMDDYESQQVQTEHVSVSKNNQTGNKKSQLLYEMAKTKNNNKTDKDKNLIDFQKNKKQLTFKPKISKSKSKEKLRCKIKGQKITISRMIRGRVQRQVRKIINAKGLPYNQKTVDKLKKEKYQEILKNTNIDFQQNNEEDQQLLISHRENHASSTSASHQIQNSFQISNNQQNKSQISHQFSNQQKKSVSNSSHTYCILPEQDLVIDVYISEEHKQKLIIRKGESLEDVAANFVKQHNLSQNKIQQLIQLLRISIKHALSPIDELIQEQDMQMLSARTYKPKQY